MWYWGIGKFKLLNIKLITREAKEVPRLCLNHCPYSGPSFHAFIRDSDLSFFLPLSVFRLFAGLAV